MNETWVLNMDEKSWTQLDSPVFPSRRVKSNMVYDESQEYFMLFSGVNNSYTHFSDTWKLEPETWAWSQIQTRYSAREAVGEQETGIIPGYPTLSIIAGVGAFIILSKRKLG